MPRTIPSPGAPPSSKAGAKSCGAIRKARAHCTLKKNTGPINSRASQVFHAKAFIATIQFLRPKNGAGWLNYIAPLESLAKFEAAAGLFRGMLERYNQADVHRGSSLFWSFAPITGQNSKIYFFSPPQFLGRGWRRGHSHASTRIFYVR